MWTGPEWPQGEFPGGAGNGRAALFPSEDISDTVCMVKWQRAGQELTLPKPLLLAELYAENLTSLQSFVPGSL